MAAELVEVFLQNLSLKQTSAVLIDKSLTLLTLLLQLASASEVEVGISVT